MRAFILLIIINLSLISYSFSQSISGRLIDFQSGNPTIAGIYLDDSLDQKSYKKILNGEKFKINNVDKIQTIEIRFIEYGSIILTGFRDLTTKEYSLGNLYLIHNPNDNLYHLGYKTKFGLLFRKFTEGIRKKKLIKKEIEKNEKDLRTKYIIDGKPSLFLQKYNGDKQILALNSIN